MVSTNRHTLTVRELLASLQSYVALDPAALDMPLFSVVGSRVGPIAGDVGPVPAFYYREISRLLHSYEEDESAVSHVRILF